MTIKRRLTSTQFLFSANVNVMWTWYEWKNP